MKKLGLIVRGMTIMLFAYIVCMGGTVKEKPIDYLVSVHDTIVPDTSKKPKIPIPAEPEPIPPIPEPEKPKPAPEPVPKPEKKPVPLPEKG